MQQIPNWTPIKKKLYLIIVLHWGGKTMTLMMKDSAINIFTAVWWLGKQTFVYQVNSYVLKDIFTNWIIF